MSRELLRGDQWPLHMLDAWRLASEKRMKSYMFIDEYTTVTTNRVRPSFDHRVAIGAVLKECGITPPKHALDSSRGWERYMAYAMKRARSNHPHNVKWKPLNEIAISLAVAEKLTP